MELEQFRKFLNSEVKSWFDDEIKDAEDLGFGYSNDFSNSVKNQFAAVEVIKIYSLVDLEKIEHCKINQNKYILNNEFQLQYTFLKYESLYFDTECTNGVRSFHNLPALMRVSEYVSNNINNDECNRLLKGVECEN